MKRPEEIKQSQSFTNNQVIYDNERFAMCVGTLIGSTEPVLGMRWYNANESSPGFPYAFNHPLWFFVPADITATFLKSLVKSGHLTSEAEDYIKKQL